MKQNIKKEFIKLTQSVVDLDKKLDEAARQRKKYGLSGKPDFYGKY